MKYILLPGVPVLAADLASAQGAVFQTPGMPNWSASSQLDRFSNVTNPAIGAMFDGFGAWTWDDDGDDGAELFLRSFEMTVNGRIDPNWWGNGVVVYHG